MKLFHITPASTCSIGLLPQAAFSQDTQGGGQLEEIIVTARKREESLMTVPVIGRNLGNKFYKLVSSGKPFAASDNYFTFTPRGREVRVQATYNV